MSRIFIRDQYGGETGSALPAVLILITVLGALGGTVFMVFLVQHRFIRRDVHRIQAQYTAEAALYYAMARLEEDVTWRPERAAIGISGNDSGYVRVEAWGGFFRITASTQVRGYHQTVRAIVGQQPTPDFNYALVLGDTKTSLHAAGHAQIGGDLLLGKQGLRPSSFRGTIFQGRIDGHVVTDEDLQMPAFDDFLFDETLHALQSLLSASPDSVADENVAAEEVPSGGMGQAILLPDSTKEVLAPGDLTLSPEDSLLFERPTTIIARGNLTIQDVDILPGSRLVAGDTLFVRGASICRGSLFYGVKGIIVSDDVECSGQFLSQREIHVEDNAYLAYPSVLFVAGSSENGRREGSIHIDDNAVVDGTLVYPKALMEPAVEAGKIIIGKNARVRGSAYSAHQTEHRGSLYGTLISYQLHFYDDPTDYVNWLKDATIDIALRPEGYLLPVGFGTSPRLEVISWEVLPAPPDTLSIEDRSTSAPLAN